MYVARLGSGAAALAAIVTATACGAGTGGPLGGGREKAEGGASSGGTAAGGTGNTTSAGANGGLPSFNLGGQGSGGLPEGQCAATSVQAEKSVEIVTDIITETVTKSTPAALYIMQDTSGSMIEQLKWNAAVDALTQFVSDPVSEGLHVGLSYFPLGIPIPDCAGNAFSVPEVGWDLLGPPGAPHNQAIIDSLLNHVPLGIGTPIEGALRGAITGCQNFESANPGIECYALLITDGAPSGCAEDAPTLIGIATAGLANGVGTFTVGMPGADFTLLDAIAVEGGTDCNGAAAGTACNAGNAQEFIAALTAIRESVTETITTEVEREVETTVPLDCEWVAPTGEEADIDTANVDFTDRSTGQKTELFRADAPEACPTTGDLAWYFSPDKTRLIACDATCDVLKAADAQIDISLGCEVRILK